MKHLLFLSYLLTITLFLQGQTTRKETVALKVQHEPVIDGKLDESFWMQTVAAKDFVQNEPNNGLPSNYQTHVHIVYSNYAIYIGALMFDPSPDSIMKQMSRRDELGQTDYFGISIDPFNDGLNGYTFVVSSGNIQFDALQSQEEDPSWDAVWNSEVSITDEGWVAEIEIPYSALRFPKKPVQKWGINMARNVQRTREKSFWNHVDAKIDGYLKQSGQLLGIENIEPPIRLSLTPYLAGYVQKNQNIESFDYSLRGGLDLKYGINESYTLDMMLIPDFGQVESDNKEFNISAFETYYEEKRPFFTEGTELFNKGEIFYSRRIGSVKDDYQSSLAANTNEVVTINPQETDLINVTKISGRGNNGLGVGILNGMAGAAYATLKDTLTGTSRKVQTQPFTNYNVLVFDQSLKNNSFVSITNTNYLQPATSYVGNVSSTHLRFENKKGTYALEGIAGFSYLDGLGHNSSTGGSYALNLEKIQGNFRFEVENSLIGKTFNANDLGYIEKTDIMETKAEVAYNIYTPFWRMLKWYNNLEFNRSSLFSINKKMGNALEFSSFTTFRNYLSINLDAEFNIGKYNDFYEARTDGRVFVRPPVYAVGAFVSPDYRKKFVIDVKGGYWSAYNENINGYWLGVMPIIRFSDRFSLNGGIDFNLDHNDEGFAGKTKNSDTIYMAQRDVRTLINYATANFIFNSKMALSLKVRHYWRLINYSRFYTLSQEGELIPEDTYHTNDVNSNFFNIDLVYTWRFAPGSEMGIVWKNAIAHEDDFSVFNYARNLNQLFEQGNQNSLSVRVVYYLDYLQVKKLRTSA
ncbi:MAG: hypothetical protein CVU09_14080 [Bacteroidetes bacterium HGW-Bacteroidetes-4]|jgi:hypothetical protein|nr:MAG: hypothetical protein CVU09_14080 [Bacteroidetes bacterium HGW-Bacteroidetes-4]